MQIGAMKVPEWSASLCLILMEVHIRNLLALPPNHITQPWCSSKFRKSVFETPGNENARSVGQALDSSSNLANF